MRIDKTEKESLQWLYDQTKAWKGSLHPSEWPEYEQWLKDAADVLEKSTGWRPVDAD